MTTSEENNAPIGFFDSGVGGLSVLKEVKKLLPNENYLYYGDTVHVPYGEKTKEQLISYSKNSLIFNKKYDFYMSLLKCTHFGEKYFFNFD